VTASEPASTPASSNGSPPSLTKTDETARVVGRHAAEPSVGQLVSDASAAMSTLIRSEIELAKLELRSTVKNAGTGAGFFAAAGVLVVFALVYFFQAIAETLDRYLVPRWAAFFIVFGFLVLVAGGFGYLGVRKVKRVRAPQQTIKTTKETVDYLKKSRG
jgi:hypothetical protein